MLVFPRLRFPHHVCPVVRDKLAHLWTIHTLSHVHRMVSGMGCGTNVGTNVHSWHEFIIYLPFSWSVQQLYSWFFLFISSANGWCLLFLHQMSPCKDRFVKILDEALLVTCTQGSMCYWYEMFLT